MVFVFMDTTANRNDNNGVAAAPPSGTTVGDTTEDLRRNFPDAFSCRCHRWYPFSRYVDEISLAFGVLSMISLISTITTYKFIEFAVGPVMDPYPNARVKIWIMDGHRIHEI
ncbi:hypothetical protein HID58_016961 [Brassica napus]|uniref:CASP-like protein n=1 Tax=Brassica napus TaxID=3708 RepID=A0ABQ8D5R6_BRANA|nr:hypothetical protein HID58_016961 [Brassica napus]